jgi:hypothetical protein
MLRLATTLWARVLTGVFLTLLVRAALAPARVAASCGDYVTVANPAHPFGPHFMPESPPGRTPPGVPVRDKAPCHTLSCEGGPAQPVPPSSSAGNSDQERWDALLSLPPGHAPTAFALPLVEGAGKPRRLASSTFHPPRPS